MPLTTDLLFQIEGSVLPISESMVQIKSLRKSGAFLTPRASCYSRSPWLSLSRNATSGAERHLLRGCGSADVGVFCLPICTFIYLLSYPLIYSFIILELHCLYLPAQTALLSSPVPQFFHHQGLPAPPQPSSR